jgi:ubiquinone/menaquinone biosynthesis C-methylase UbiE
MPDKNLMLMNWPERVWIYSPVRAWVLRRHAGKLLRLRGPMKAQTALEIGCGTGKGATILVKTMGFERVHAFDLEEPLIRRAVKGLPAAMSDKISFFVGDAQTLPFSDSRFDAVVNFGIIHHVLDWRGCIREIGRVLKTGGTFFFEEIYPPLYANFLLGPMLRHPREDRFDGPLFLAELEKNGLRMVKGVSPGTRFGIVCAAVKG